MHIDLTHVIHGYFAVIGTIGDCPKANETAKKKGKLIPWIYGAKIT